MLRNVLLVLALAACGKSKCEKYAAMEWKCGNYPASEKEMTLQLAEGFCEAADVDKTMAKFGKEADCATKFTDCAEYEKCTNAIAE
jgi:hypothetical protein